MLNVTGIRYLSTSHSENWNLPAHTIFYLWVHKGLKFSFYAGCVINSRI